LFLRFRASVLTTKKSNAKIEKLVTLFQYCELQKPITKRFTLPLKMNLRSFRINGPQDARHLTLFLMRYCHRPNHKNDV
jgi:hypothetical protein